MATSFTLKTDDYQGRYMQLHCEQVPDAAKNQSRINWTLSVLGGQSSYYKTGPTTATIGGKLVYYCKQMQWDTKVFPAAKGSVSSFMIIDHDEHGNCEIPVTLETSIYTGIIKSYGGTWTLDGLVRKVTITSAESFADVDNPSILFSNEDGYRVDVWLDPNMTGDRMCIRENIPNTGSYTWNLTDEERNALRDKCTGKSCPIRIRLCAYVGEVQYLDDEDVTYTVTENEATKPTVNLSVVQNNGSLPSAFDGLCIQSKTRLSVEVSAQAKHGAHITQYTTNISGKLYAGKSFVSDAIQDSGNVTIRGRAQDSRGIWGEAEQQIYTTAYSKPLVIPTISENGIVCYRSDDNGNRLGTSTKVWVKAARSYYKVMSDGIQKNFCSLQWRKKLSTETWDDAKHQWNYLLKSENTDSDEYIGLLEGTVFDLQKAYTIQVKAVDDIGEYDLKTLDVPTRDVALHLGRGGKNVSIGAFCDYSEEYTFYSAWKAIFGNGIVDTTDTQWATIDDIIHYRKKLGHVTVVGISSGNAELAGGTYTTVATIPELYAPEISIPVVCHYSGEEQTRLSGYLRPNGNIELHADGSGTSYWAFSVTYPI